MSVRTLKGERTQRARLYDVHSTRSFERHKTCLPKANNLVPPTPHRHDGHFILPFVASFCTFPPLFPRTTVDYSGEQPFQCRR